MYQVIKKTGWSWHYVLWRISRANILLMIADQSNVKSIKPGEEKVIHESGKEMAARYKQKK